MQDILLATNNQGKVERYAGLIEKGGISSRLHTPAKLGIEAVRVEESGTTLMDNAILKARAYFGKTDMPILANDTGFWLETEGFVTAPKRVALQGESELTLSKEQVSERLLTFWQKKAADNGGQVIAAWVDVFVVLCPDNTLKTAEARREVILTDTVFGKPHIELPVRALYISRITNRPAITHTEAEEMQEMQPITEALRKVLIL